MGRTHPGPRTGQPLTLNDASNEQWEGRLRLWISVGGRNALGPGKVRLLDAIDATRSLAAAAKRLGMSYRLAWKHLRLMEEWTHMAVVEPRRGGRDGGGTVLTPEGRALLAAYHAFRSDMDAHMRSSFNRRFAVWSSQPRPDTSTAGPPADETGGAGFGS